jgi:hypothetical protein
MRRGVLTGAIIAALGFKRFRVDLKKMVNPAGRPKNLPL